jgi:branched-chain amino acid transport system permease protein
MVLAAAAAAAWLLAPLALSDFWLSVLNLAGIAAIGAAGLNLLTGYCGQVSLGHAFFLGAGAYTCAWLGGTLDLPAAVWLPAAALVGAALGAAVGPFALRFEGNYLAVVSLALVFVGQHVFRNWDGLTGGPAGRGDLPSVAAAPGPLSGDQWWFWILWAGVAGTVWACANLVRSRPGRAMVAVRDNSLAAAVIGVDVARTKIAAFAASSALAALAGALYGSYRHYVGPEEWDLLLSVQYVAIVIVGGVGTVAGPVLGALFVGSLPRLVEEVSPSLPFVAHGTGSGLTVAQLNQLLYGALIVAFVVLEPKGLAAVWSRLRRRLERAV